MTTGQDSYQTVLEDLERKRDELTTAINTLRNVMGLAPSDTADGGSPGGRPMTSRKLRSDEFFNMSILDAAKRFLAVIKQPTTAPDIARALKSHGLINDSPKFAGTVYSVLFREENRGKGSVIQSTGKRWGLAEWYPNRKPKVKGATSANGDAIMADPAVADDPPSEPEQPS